MEKSYSTYFQFCYLNTFYLTGMSCIKDCNRVAKINILILKCVTKISCIHLTFLWDAAKGKLGNLLHFSFCHATNDLVNGNIRQNDDSVVKLYKIAKIIISLLILRIFKTLWFPASNKCELRKNNG